MKKQILKGCANAVIYAAVMCCLALLRKDGFSTSAMKLIACFGLHFIVYSIVYPICYWLLTKNDEKKESSTKTREIFIKSLLRSLQENLSRVAHYVSVVHNGKEDYSITCRIEQDSPEKTIIQRVKMPINNHYTSEDMQNLIKENIDQAEKNLGLKE